MSEWSLWMLTHTGRSPIVQKCSLETAMYTLDLAVKRRRASGWAVTARNAQCVVLRNGPGAITLEIIREEQ
jgi:uncharacterized protein (UPF0218 family)